MKTILALAAILVFALPVAAQNNCNIELKPLKPLTPLGCTDTTPICLCGGTRCHWTWACVPQGVPSMTAPATAPSWLPSGIDPTIPLQVSPVQMPDLMETYRKALEIRNLQLQEQALQPLRQQNQQTMAAPTDIHPPIPVLLPEGKKAPTLLRPSERVTQAIDGDASAKQAEDSPAATSSEPSADTWKTAGLYNGRGWRIFSPFDKLLFLTGAFEAVQVASGTEVVKYFPGSLAMAEFIQVMDRFYEAAENRPIPILYAVRAATMKANGEDPMTFEITVAAMRKAALELQKGLH